MTYLCTVARPMSVEESLRHSCHPTHNRKRQDIIKIGLVVDHARFDHLYQRFGQLIFPDDFQRQ